MGGGGVGYLLGVNKKRELDRKVKNQGLMGQDGGELVSAIPKSPLTPQEPMEFLSRSWSLSTSEISKAILINGGSSGGIGSGGKSKRFRNYVVDRFADALPPPETLSVAASRRRATLAVTRRANVGRWFRSNEDNKKSIAKKERDRADKARAHAAVSVAAVSAAVAAVAAQWSACPNGQYSLMVNAMASATELIASHFIEIAEQKGADRDKVVSTIQSAVGVRSAEDLTTLTAAAATALRATATLKHRSEKEGGRHASTVIPCGTSPDFFCQEGLLLKRTRGGALHWKKVNVYINKKSNVIVKLKSKHIDIGGAFSKRKSCIVYGVYEDIPAWPGRGSCSGGGGIHFGVSTSQGIIEFECENEKHKQKWVDGIRNLIHQICCDGNHQLARRIDSIEPDLTT